MGTEPLQANVNARTNAGMCDSSVDSHNAVTGQGGAAGRFGALRRWWTRRSVLAQLGAMDQVRQDAAMARLAAQGDSARPLLRRALRAGVPTACGAARVLADQGCAEGIEAVLTRCYEEEWLYRCLEDGYVEGLVALARIGREPIGGALLSALDAACGATELADCLPWLVRAVSAARILSVFKDESPLDWWERALLIGHGSLDKLGGDSSVVLAYNLTDALRAEAVRGLLNEHRGEALRVFRRALAAQDQAVVLSAIRGLQYLGDARALPALQAIAFSFGHPLANYARRAVERLAGSNADALILLRPSEAEISPEELLRAAQDTIAPAEEAASLMRPI